MTVSERRKRLSYSKRVNDLDVGDYVCHTLTRKRGIVIEAGDGFVTVDYLDGSVDSLPIPAFRKLRGRRRDSGHQFDARGR